MKILYLTNSRLPGEKAHAIQILKTCAALGEKAKVKIVHARRINRPWLKTIEDMQSYYKLPRQISIKSVYSLDLFRIAHILSFGMTFAYRIAFAIQMITYHISLLPYLLNRKSDVYYTRDSLTAVLLVVLGKYRTALVLYESHYFPSTMIGVWIIKLLSKYLNGVVVLTKMLSEKYVNLGIASDRVIVIPDAVDIESFNRCSKQEARDILGIKPDSFLVMYVGHMYHWKGVDTLIKASQLLNDDAEVWLVGGTPEEMPRIEELVSKLNVNRVHLAGYVPYYNVSTYMTAADVLVVPNSGAYDISKYYTSPIKLFEYMASRRPIVVADLPSLREVVTHEETALLFEPDDANSLAAAIKLLHADSVLSEKLAANAAELSKKYTWSNRADSILSFVNNLGIK